MSHQNNQHNAVAAKEPTGGVVVEGDFKVETAKGFFKNPFIRRHPVTLTAYDDHLLVHPHDNQDGGDERIELSSIVRVRISSYMISVEFEGMNFRSFYTRGLAAQAFHGIMALFRYRSGLTLPEETVQNEKKYGLSIWLQYFQDRSVKTTSSLSADYAKLAVKTLLIFVAVFFIIILAMVLVLLANYR